MRYDLLVTLKSDAGIPLAVSDYEIAGHVQCAASPLALDVVSVDEDRVRVSFGPVEQGYYRYDLFIRYRGCHAESRLLYGRLTVAERFGDREECSRNGGDELEVVVQRSGQVIECRLMQVTIVSAADWAAIQACADRSEESAEEAERVLARVGSETAEAVRTVQEAAQQAGVSAAEKAKAAIAAQAEESGDTIRQVAAEQGASVCQSLESTAAVLIGELRQTEQESVQRISDHTSVQLVQAEDMLATACQQGEATLSAAVTSGTGTIRAAADSGKVAIDDYVASTQADLSRKSQANIWSGVNTFNAPAVFNASVSVSTATPLGADPFTDTQRLTGLLDGQQLQALYGGRPLPLTYETHATDAYYDGSKRAGYAFMFGRASAVGAWRSAWLTSQQVISGNMWVNVPTSTGGTRRQTARTGTYAVNILPASSNTDNITSPPPVVVGLNTFFTGHAAGDSLPPTKRPWDPHIIQQPHHANWNQPKAVVCCEAHGHKIATLHIYVGYGGSVIDKDVTPASIRYNCIPCIRYKSPIANVSTITTIYITADSNGQGYHNGTTRTYIQTSDGQLVSVIGTPLDQRYNSVGVLALSKAGTQAAACIRDIVHYPNIRPASYYANSVQYYNPVHPIETWLESNTTHKIQRPAKPLKEKISIAYAAAAPEEYPCDILSANINGGVMDAQTQGNYSSQLHISKAAQDMQITCPAGWVIDVDIWSEDWCVAEGNTLHIMQNDTGVERYVSVWIYAPNNTNTTDGTNVVWEYGINQMNS